MKKLFLKFLIFVLPISTFGQIQYKYTSVDFESKSPTITLSNASNNIWQIGVPSKSKFNSAHSGSHAIVTDILNYYPTNNYSQFEFTFKVSPMTNRSTFSFWHKFDMDLLKDSARIDVSYDGGLSWNNIVTDSNYEIIQYGSNNSSYTSLAPTVITGVSADWEQVGFEWSWFIPVRLAANSGFQMWPDSVMVRFNFFSDGNQTNRDGWMIDDILIEDVSGISGVSDPTSSLGNMFTIYPNPSTDQINLSYKGVNGNNALIKVFNSEGSEIYKLEEADLSNIIPVDLKGKEKGIYFVQLIVNEQSITKKIILE